MSRKLFWPLFAFIVILSIVVRFYQLGKLPFSLYWDEAAMLVDVKSVTQTGKDMFGRPWYQVIYPSYGDFKLPVYIWSAAAAAKLFGVNEFALRLPSALAGVGTVIVAGYLARKFSTRKKTQRLWQDQAQLITMVIMAVSPWSVMFSRTGFEGHLAQFLLAVSALCVMWSPKKPWLLYLSPVFGAVATYTYFSVRFVWIAVFGVTECLVLLQMYQSGQLQLSSSKRATLVQQLTPVLKLGITQLVLPFIIFGILFIPMLRSPLYGDTNRFRLGTDSILNTGNPVLQSNIDRELAGNSRFDRIIFHRWWLTGQELLKHYSDHLSFDFLFVTGDPNLRHGTGQYGLFFFIFLPCFLAGAYYFATREKAIGVVLLIWWLVALLPASVPNDTPHALRSLNALVPLAIVIGCGTLYLYQVLLRYSNWQWLGNWRPIRARIIAALGMSFIALSSVVFFYHYFTVYPVESAQAWQGGYKPLALAIFMHKTPEEPVYVLPFDDRFYLWVMAYGPYSGREFQSWQSKAYKFDTAIPYFSFQQPEEKNIHQPTILAGRAEDVQHFLSSSTLHSGPLTFIPVGDHQHNFVVTEVTPSL